ncbi:hypothetical protein THAOC_12271 [Thalassiosira oceanica]|uniref:Uncharacterized protein n=1 Tax=Thalassiosira oceanica TaxID=159749 RepID=K0T8I4_THAOC|nr:hypothetical protein THAOC_12271 [Thalassiosira oceanica]|eukprot:EJK66777.1 hypothetical protein THAOC_12271 [Thalassiosira oceanica]
MPTPTDMKFYSLRSVQSLKILNPCILPCIWAPGLHRRILFTVHEREAVSVCRYVEGLRVPFLDASCISPLLVVGGIVCTGR